MNIESILEAATQVGLVAYADFIRATAKETVDICLCAGDAGLRASRFGGVPALPPGFQWPIHVLGRYGGEMS